MIFHTDRGAEYTSAACIEACERLGLRRSMGRTGSCLDNAVAESFFATLKVELVDRCHYRTRAQARASIFRWIAWYNQRRLHSTNDYLPPLEWNSGTAMTTHHRQPWPHSQGVRPAGGSPWFLMMCGSGAGGWPLNPEWTTPWPISELASWRVPQRVRTG